MYDSVLFFVCLVFCATAPSGPGPPHSRGLEITLSDAPQSVGLLCTSDQPVAETSTWQHTTLTTDRQPCHRQDSNPRSQQAGGCRTTLAHVICMWWHAACLTAFPDPEVSRYKTTRAGPTVCCELLCSVACIIDRSAHCKYSRIMIKDRGYSFKWAGMKGKCRSCKQPVHHSNFLS